MQEREHFTLGEDEVLPFLLEKLTLGLVHKSDLTPQLCEAHSKAGHAAMPGGQAPSSGLEEKEVSTLIQECRNVKKP